MRKDFNLEWQNETKLIGNNEKIDSYSLAVGNVDVAYSGRKISYFMQKNIRLEYPLYQ